MKRSCWAVLGLVAAILAGAPAMAGVTSAAIRETAEYVMKKFGRGAAGQTVEEVADTTARVVTRYGDDALPLIRGTGHRGFAALEQAGAQAPDVIRLYARKGDEAVWLISEPKKLTIFLKHGDSAADALIKHPKIADELIGRFGDDAVGAVNGVSRRGAQRVGMIADEGVLTATPRSPELLPVIGRYGDEAADFIWRNKGALTVATVLGSFLADPQAYISGAKQLIVDPILGPLVQNTNWTWIIAGLLFVVFLPYLVRSIARARREARNL
jgi:hypothetical protein